MCVPVVCWLPGARNRRRHAGSCWALPSSWSCKLHTTSKRVRGLGSCRSYKKLAPARIEHCTLSFIQHRQQHASRLQPVAALLRKLEHQQQPWEPAQQKVPRNRRHPHPRRNNFRSRTPSYAYDPPISLATRLISTESYYFFSRGSAVNYERDTKFQEPKCSQHSYSSPSDQIPAMTSPS